MRVHSVLTAFLFAASAGPAATVHLDVLDLGEVRQGWGEPHARRSVEGNPLRIGGKTFDRGLGTHAEGEWALDLGAGATRLTAWVGVDAEKQGEGTVEFRVVGDGKVLFDSGVMKGRDPARPVDVPLAGVKRIRLLVGDGGDGINCDHADWADLAIEYAGPGRPTPSKVAEDPPPPIRAEEPAAPAIHGPRVVGTTPGRPFLFLIPATGEGPLSFSASGLPAGLSLDPGTGIISGSVDRPGTWKTEVSAEGARGRAVRTLMIVAGERKLALTPPMGWNSWNVWGCSVDAARVRAAADAMVKSGLAAHGYAYVNIDDCWEGSRGPDGEIRTNGKFPDMKGLADYVHARGLKLGIYSGPGPKTCAGHVASWKHEAKDAGTWAKWGIDYLKYDWCSYGDVATGEGRERAVRPYRVMREALDACGRDIVFSFCQYGMDDVWEWGEKTGGNLWRTTGDITDSWGSLADIAFRQPAISKWAGPGHWNDPDMLVVGRVGWGPNLHPTGLKPNAQVLHLTAWAMLAAPLLVGCDLDRLDEFTLALLTNDEVIDVDQDPLGKAAERVAATPEAEVWARPLVDGTTAVALFNKGFDRADIAATWKELGLEGELPVRDCWLHRDLGVFSASFSATVPARGAMLVRIGRPGK